MCTHHSRAEAKVVHASARVPICSETASATGTIAADHAGCGESTGELRVLEEADVPVERTAGADRDEESDSGDDLDPSALGRDMFTKQ